MKVHMLTQVSGGGFNGLNWENTRSLLHFLYFSPREHQKCFRSLRRFLDPSDVFSTHSTPVASGRYVFRYGLLRPPRGHPRGDPGLAPDSAALRFRLRDPSLLPFRSFRKVVRDPKKSFENEHFFCSLERKKKFQRPFSNLFAPTRIL